MQEEKSNERQKTIISFLSSAWKLSFLVKRMLCTCWMECRELYFLQMVDHRGL